MRKTTARCLPYLALALLAACASQDSAAVRPSPGDVVVDIEFDSSGCPQPVRNDGFDIDKSKRIFWQAVDARGAPVGMDYAIYFDPFTGRPLKSNAEHGSLRSPQFREDSPPSTGTAEVEYKYTIVGSRCPDQPRDPRFRLRR